MTDRLRSLLGAVGARVVPGTKAMRFLPVPGFSPNLDLPLILVQGHRQGPVAIIIAGVHGGEYNGIEAARRVGVELDPASVNGAVAIVPLANRAAFHARSHNGAPPDAQNLARLVPGVAEGKALERVAHVLTTTLIQHGDLVLDIHGADALEDLTPHLYVPPLASGYEARRWSGWDLAEVYGIELVELVGPEKLAGSAAHAGATLGIPSILPEAGAFGHINDRDMPLHYHGILNVLRRVGILDGAPTPVRNARRVRHERVYSPATGCFYASVRAGHVARRGEVLGEVKDYFGGNPMPITAPVDGEVDFIKYTLATNKGDSLFLIATEEGA